MEAAGGEVGLAWAATAAVEAVGPPLDPEKHEWLHVQILLKNSGHGQSQKTGESQKPENK